MKFVTSNSSWGYGSFYQILPILPEKGFPPVARKALYFCQLHKCLVPVFTYGDGCALTVETYGEKFLKTSTF